MITFRSLSECTIRQVVEVLNRGFENYFVKMTWDERKVLARLVREDLSPQHSIVAFYQEEPVGIVLNGFRQIEGKKVAWNGGTGVAKPFRGQGIGQAMIEKSLTIYQSQQVDMAMLEALEENAAAISLYQKMGYFIVDSLYFYSRPQGQQREVLEANESPYRVVRRTGYEIEKLSFWQPWTPWQTQLASLPEAESLFIYSKQNEPLGYALFTEKRADEENKCKITLYQCGIAPEAKKKKPILKTLFANLFSGDLNRGRDCMQITGSTFNLRADQDVIDVLQEEGFQQKRRQVWMVQK